MATRREVSQQKAALKTHLRAGCRDGTYLPGEPAPSLRELAQQYGLSRTVVAQALGDLIEEGVLYSVPRIGTFIGRPKLEKSGFYLFLTPYPVANNYQFQAVQEGFEEAIARLGGASLSLTRSLARRHWENGELPPLAGVFDIRPFDTEGEQDNFLRDGGVATVCFQADNRLITNGDSIAFDNVDGGRQAACHLLQLGQKRIAYLGLHGPGSDPRLHFSAEREEGWRQALMQAGHATEDLAFHPETATDSDHEAQIGGGRSAASHLVRHRDITAVVTANAHALQGLFRELTAAEVPTELWPTVVSFDDDSIKEGHVVSILRLPWAELGAAAATLLWERANNRLQGPPEQRLVSMRMISRLTSLPEWARSSNLAASQLAPENESEQDAEAVPV